jgi:hypothetical protein
MALKDWFNQEIYREFANKHLFQHKKAPSAVVIREAFGNNGSLSTHQTLLEAWKKEQNIEVIELPQKVEEIIVKKNRELFVEGWKALEEASRAQNLKIQQEAIEAIQIARDVLNRTIHEKNLDLVKQTER